MRGPVASHPSLTSLMTQQSVIALRFTPVVAKQFSASFYVSLRSLPNRRHWRLATVRAERVPTGHPTPHWGLATGNSAFRPSLCEGLEISLAEHPLARMHQRKRYSDYRKTVGSSQRGSAVMDRGLPGLSDMYRLCQGTTQHSESALQHPDGWRYRNLRNRHARAWKMHCQSA